MNKLMKVSITLGVLLSGVALGEIKLTDNLGFSGFLDMSAGFTDDGTVTSTYAGFDQLELDFMYDFKNGATARADVNSMGGGAVVLEQAYFTQPLGPVNLTAGKFLSSTGFECAEPVCMYQYSWSNTLVYGGYQNGIAASFGSDMVAVYLAAIGSVWDGSDTDIESPGLEAQISLMPTKEATIKVAYAADMETEIIGMDAMGMDSVIGTIDNQTLINSWASYTAGSMLFAAEFNYLMNWGANDNNGMGYLVMTNIGLNDKTAVTVRYSAMETDNTPLNSEVTLSPSYVISDNLGALLEFQYQIDAESMVLAVESIYSF